MPVPAGHAAGPGLSALALSPDASKVAIAYMFLTSPPARQPLILYSVKTGAVLRTWTTASGIISGTGPMGGSGAGPGAAMRWTADGRELAFAFYANAKPGKNGYGYQQSASIRLLDTSAPGSSLLAGSKVLAGPGPVYTPAYGTGMQCLAQDGWSISANGEALTCATQWGTPGEQLPASLRSAQCTATTGTGQVNLGFLRQYWLPSGGGGGGPVYGPCTAGTVADIQLDWANSDATLVLGGLKLPGHLLFGLFSGGKLTALPAPPAGLPGDIRRLVTGGPRSWPGTHEAASAAVPTGRCRPPPPRNRRLCAAVSGTETWSRPADNGGLRASRICCPIAGRKEQKRQKLLPLT